MDDNSKTFMILTSILFLIVTVSAILITTEYTDNQAKSKQIKKLTAQLDSTTFTKASLPEDVSKVFKNAKKGQRQVYYQDSMGQQITKQQYDMATNTEKKAFKAYLNKTGGKLMSTQCFQIDSKEDDWAAGYCIYNTLETYGKEDSSKPSS